MKSNLNKSTRGGILLWIGIVFLLIGIFVGAYPKIVSTIGITSDFLGGWPSETVVTIGIAFIGVVILMVGIARSLSTRYGK